MLRLDHVHGQLGQGSERGPTLYAPQNHFGLFLSLRNPHVLASYQLGQIFCRVQLQRLRSVPGFFDVNGQLEEVAVSNSAAATLVGVYFFLVSNVLIGLG